MADLDPGTPSASVLHLLNASNRQLQHLLENLRNEPDAEGALRDIAGDVIHAVEQHADIALAAILLNQIAGSYAVRHCIETAVVVVVMARRLGKTRVETLTLTAAALTMNVGMLRHQDTFQNKHTPLSSEELAIVRRHPEDSANLLQCAGVQDDDWISCVLLHHENDDGSGYPAGIASPEVTLNAKLLSLADRYCAQVSARNYRRSILPDQALRALREDRANPVDADLLDVFQQELGDYPPGCLVRLHGGEIGVVSRRGADGPGQVICLRDAAGAVVTAEARPLPTTAIAAAITEDEADTRFSMKQVWGAQAGL
ncbi:HD-GYP domain-containing protein (c-di-GMP phosphodiesterase class II) [Duganella sp. 3397]|uniref:HD-GYP domain-containing protein n=1 Tax=Duganella sp. 3397 TaxID=2817732 RepID=UPI002859E505|nr:HD domain-containing phosphohydrolase [Duganella sp. 3397]MDR7049263.1 HD-GYP domain-containing protein (c-di-GMP phosphodiesterase class II) [Duganella sp. 3397]